MGFGTPEKSPEPSCTISDALPCMMQGPTTTSAPGGKAEGLMAETDAEHRDFGIEDAEDFHAVSGVLGMAGAGGEAHHVQGRVLRQFEQPGIVVFDDHGILPERVESLHEVVGERVVVIDEQEHGLLRWC